MRSFACALLVIAAIHATKACTPGEKKKDGLNTCFCLGDSLGWVCAQSHTSPLATSSSELLREKRQVEESEDSCEPGQHFRFFCRYCRCSADGKISNSACTMQSCPLNIWNRDGSLKNPQEIAVNIPVRKQRDLKGHKALCEPGQTFKYYCNTCTCRNDGLASNALCTRMHCDLEKWNIDGTQKHLEEHITNYANQFGLSWRQPKEVEEGSGKCVPESVFMHYCNECYCLHDGLVENAFCTRMYCDRNKWNEDGTRKYPEEDAIILENEENDRKNHEDTPEDRVIDPYPIHFPSVYKRDAEEGRCHTGAIFKKFCNYCVCGTDRIISKAPCTNMKCDLEVWNEDGTRKFPEEDEIILENEENDRKNHEDAPEDRVLEPYPIHLPPVYKRDAEEGRCHTGAIFKKFCNYCFCGTDRIISNAPCTSMKCDLEVWNEDGTRKYPEEDEIILENEENDRKNHEDAPEDRVLEPYPIHLPPVYKRDAEEGRCHTGAIFKKFCNYCVCGTDRIISKAPCTNMKCDLEVWNEDGTRKYPEEDEIILENEENDRKNHEDAPEDRVLEPYPIHLPPVYKRDAEEGRCHTGAIFKKFCNYCFCGTDRIISNAPCTSMKCDLEVWNEDGTRKYPEEDEIILENEENDRKNHEDAPEDRVLEPYPIHLPPVYKRDADEGRCHTGAIFKKFCNYCFCGTDRIISNAPCTSMKCDLEVWNEDGTRKYPEEDEIILENEENDRKNHEDAPEDRVLEPYPIHLPPVYKRDAEEGRCHTGAIFKKFCNYCVCGTDRIISNAPCTSMKCDLEVWNEDGTRKYPEEDEIILENEENDRKNHEDAPEDRVLEPYPIHLPPVYKRDAEEGRCHTGAIFKKFCNYCVCGTDRIISNAPCTSMKCDLEVWNEDGTRKYPEEDEAILENEYYEH